MNHKHTIDIERAKECLRLCEELEDFTEELNERERDFLSNIHARLDTYQEKTFVSTDQYNWLSSIYSRVIG